MSRTITYAKLILEACNLIKEKFDDDSEIQLYQSVKYEMAVDAITKLNITLIDVKILLMATLIDHLKTL